MTRAPTLEILFYIVFMFQLTGNPPVCPWEVSRRTGPGRVAKHMDVLEEAVRVWGLTICCADVAKNRENCINTAHTQHSDYCSHRSTFIPVQIAELASVYAP